MAEENNDKFTKRVREVLLVYSLLFWYGVITRLPFIYFVIHMRFQFDMDWVRIGFFVGSYQASRVITGIATVFLPPLATHFLGTAIALAGNMLVLISDTSDQIPFLLGTTIIGFAETLACMQTYLKGNYLSDLDLLGHKMKLQYAAVCIGVTFAFAFGGVVYQFAGIKGIAVFGTLAALMELLSLSAFVILEKDSNRTYDYTTDKDGCDSKDHTSSNETDTEKHGDSTSYSHEDPFVLPTSLLPRNGRNLIAYASDDEVSDYEPSEAGDDESQISASEEDKTKYEAAEPPSMTEEELKKMVDRFSSSGASPNYITYVLCFTFGMEAITIGYNLAVSPIYITEQFGRSTGVIGIMLAAGAAFGTLVSISMTLSKRGKRFMDRLLPDPNGFLFGMSGISVAVLLAAVPIFPVHLMGCFY